MKSFFGKIAAKITVGYLVLILMLLIVSAAGFAGIFKAKSMLTFLSGPAWETADGAMEGVIETESQMLGVFAKISGEKLSSSDQDVNVAGAAAKEAFDRMRTAGLLSSESLEKLDKLHKEYQRELDKLLANDEAEDSSRGIWLDSSSKFEEKLSQIEQQFTQLEVAANATQHDSANCLYPLLLNLRRLELSWRQLECTINQNKLQKSGSNSTELVQYLATLDTAIESLITVSQSNELFASVTPLTVELKTTAIDVRTNVCRYVDFSTELYAQREKFSAAASNMLEYVGVLEDEADGKVTAVIDQIGPTSSVVTNTIVFATIACIIASLITSFIVSRSITKPLYATISALEKISGGDGDLTQRLDENVPGELGTVATYFNRFAVQVQKAMKEINDQMLRLSQSSESLGQSAKQNSVQSTELRDKSAQMTLSISEMTTSIEEIAKSSERAASKADVTASMASNADSKLASLDTAAGDIGRVVNVIEEIAEQTNLLALNATIEAARAGEAGRGFTVVATEVKELAKQTAKATDDIRRRVDGIQISAREVVASIREMTEAIGLVCSESRTIASAVEEQSTVTRDLARHVGDGLRATETIAEFTRNTETGLDELNAIAESMESLIQQYKLERDSRREYDYQSA